MHVVEDHDAIIVDINAIDEGVNDVIAELLVFDVAIAEVAQP